jgi:hypothetical protein
MVSISVRTGAGSGVSSRDKKARRAQLRDFLMATPGAIDRAGDALGWLVVLGAVALGALLLHLAFAPRGAPPVPPPGGIGDNPSGVLFVRDLRRLPDGRHTFDLVYELVVRNGDEPQLRFVSVSRRLSIGDPPPAADIVDLGQAPGVRHQAIGRWHELSVTQDNHYGQPNGDIPPGHWQVVSAHYRVNARPDQFADVAIGIELDHQPHRGWFNRQPLHDLVANDEEVQFGAVLRAHCGLGVKIQNGEMRSLCGS